MTAIGSNTPTYDANGEVTNDYLNSYAWDQYGRPTTVNSVGITYDALGRAVEMDKSGTYNQIQYSPTGFKMQIINGTTLVKAFVPMPGGAAEVWTPTANFFRHADWLGSSRLASLTSGSSRLYYDGAYGPFGEQYANTGTTDLSFTGMNQDTSSNVYDFPAREYGIQGRWPSPDPAGLAAANPADPQTWNRYCYVRNSPMSLVDFLGLDPCPLVIAGTGDNPGNSPGIMNFAASIGANVVFPLPNMGPGIAADLLPTETTGGTQATSQGVQASSGPGGGPTTVFTFSAGAAYYNSVPNPGATNVNYVMPYFGAANTYPSFATGTSTTNVYTGKGALNWLLDTVISPPLLPGTEHWELSMCDHDANCAFGDDADILMGPNVGAPCKTPQIFVPGFAPSALGGGGAGGGLAGGGGYGDLGGGIGVDQGGGGVWNWDCVSAGGQKQCEWFRVF